MSRNKDELADEIREQLEEWNLGLDDFQNLIERSEVEAESSREERIRQFRKDYDRARERFETLDESDPDAWREFRDEAIEARRLLDEAMEEAQGRQED